MSILAVCANFLKALTEDTAEEEEFVGRAAYLNYQGVLAGEYSPCQGALAHH